MFKYHRTTGIRCIGYLCPASVFAAVEELRGYAAKAESATTDVVEQIDYVGQLAGCHELHWSWQSEGPDLDRPILSGLVPASAGRPEAERWAVALGLEATRRPITGTISYEGDLGGLRVRVWTVVDHQKLTGPVPARTGPETLIGVTVAALLGAALFAHRAGVLARLRKLVSR